MDLDHRAGRARNSLHDHVTRSVDVDVARGRLDALGRRRHKEVRQARIATLALVAVAGVLAALVVTGGGPASKDGTNSREVAVNRQGPDTGDQEILEQLPASPIDGKQSWRLPVLAEPQSGVHDGQVIKVYGRGFDPQERLGIVHCSSEADVANAGVDACDLGGSSYESVQYANAAPDGTVVVEVTVHRFIETPRDGRVDCASAFERCIIGVGALANYDRSGGTYIQFADAPPAPEAAVTVTPSSDLTPGQEVDVAATGWVPSRPTRIQQCKADVCENLLDGHADVTGSYSATVVLNDQIVVDGVAQPCDGECVLRITGIGLPGQTSAVMPDDVPLTFVPAADGATTTTHPTTTTTAPPSVTAVPSTTPAERLCPNGGDPAMECEPATEDPVVGDTTASIVTPTTSCPATANCVEPNTDTGN